MIKDSIAKRLIHTVFIFYCIIAMAVTALHIVQEYQHTKDSIRLELKSYEKIFSPVLAQAMWDFDGDRIQTILTAMQEVPIIKGVKIIQNGNGLEEFIGIGDVEKEAGKFIHLENGTMQGIETTEYQLFTHQFTIEFKYDDQVQKLGTAYLYSSFDVVFDRVQLGFIFLIINALIKSIALWFIIYWFGKKIVFKPLQKFTDKIKKIKLNDLSKESFDQFKQGDFELYDLETSFSQLINKLEGHQEEIVSLNKSLEDKVELRTSELLQQKSKAEKALRVKSDFLATMSHEIRTPMNGVLGMLNILDGSNLNERDNKNVKIAKKSADNLLLLINDILDISKIESGNLTLEKNTFNLSEEIHSVVGVHKIEAESKGLSLSLIQKIDQNLLVIGDRIRLGQIINNLTNNAIKFTSEGVVDADFRVEHAGNTVTLFGCIKDTGIGISEEDAGKLFGAFTQADASASRKFGGSGLGLSIVKSVCEEMGGSIWLDSPEGQGAKFSFSVELQSAVKEQGSLEVISSAEEKPDAADVGLPAGKILLVEDNAINQMVAMDLLEGLNQRFIVAENGQQAIEMLIESHDIDLILMDCQMPIMDGYSATRAIRSGEAGQAYQAIPIIAVTANAMAGDKEKCLDSGMDAYLSKPINISELKAKLLAYLGKGSKAK